MEGSVFPYKRWHLTKAHLYILLELRWVQGVGAIFSSDS